MFFRLVFGMIAAIVTITVMRTVIGSLFRLGANSALRRSAPAPPSQTQPDRAPFAAGKLEKCAVCGVYSPAAARDGNAAFCSLECAAKFASPVL
jgi:hypothetical protein